MARRSGSGDIFGGGSSKGKRDSGSMFGGGSKDKRGSGDMFGSGTRKGGGGGLGDMFGGGARSTGSGHSDDMFGTADRNRRKGAGKGDMFGLGASAGKRRSNVGVGAEAGALSSEIGKAHRSAKRKLYGAGMASDLQAVKKGGGVKKAMKKLNWGRARKK